MTRESALRAGGNLLRLPIAVSAAVAAAYAVGSYMAFLLFHASSAGAVLFPAAGASLDSLPVVYSVDPPLER